MRVLLSFIVACCLLGWPVPASAETDVIRIPRGAGGVGWPAHPPS